MNLIIEMSILIAAPILVVWALRAWYKRQGASGMAQTTGKGLGILASVIGAAVVLFGKAVIEFIRLGKTADDDTESSLSTPLVLDSDTFDAEGCFKDDKGNIYL